MSTDKFPFIHKPDESAAATVTQLLTPVSAVSAGPEPLAPAHEHSQPHLHDVQAPPARQHLAPLQRYSPSMNSPLAARRTLPPVSFTTDQAFEDAYVQFILYCNPGVPYDASTHDLRKNFASPPRSDSKTFSTRRLFELLQQLDRKELKTWTELALKLGVEKPSIEKGQSSQKVQQYSVRLKRWLRASHIDAFFDYMMGKSHSYLDLPPVHAPFPEQRDGVFAEDDLALRALKPEFRPKRGRRRAGSEEPEPATAVDSKRPHLDPAFTDPSHPPSAYPASAHPNGADRYHSEHWPTPATAGALSALPHNSPGQHRWRFADTPSTPRPPSALSPTSAHPVDSSMEEESISQSQKMKMRRRHGTAVSSAWPSNSTTPNGKLRGRPPTNRSVRDGPFISFPANPAAKEGPPVELGRHPVSTPIDDGRPPDSAHANSPFRLPAYPTPVSATDKLATGRPERLSVTVPQHVGNPVRLVTPTVAINGERDHAGQYEASASCALLGFDDLQRALAADLLQAEISGGKPLRGTEAKDLAQALLASLSLQLGSDQVDKMTIASWLGLNPPNASNQRWSSVSIRSAKKITVRRFKLNHDGYYIPSEADDRDQSQKHPSYQPHVQTKETFDVEWDLALGGLCGKFHIKGLVLGAPAPNEHPTSAPSAAGANRGAREPEHELHNSKDLSWEQRYASLQQTVQRRDAQIQELKDRILEAVL